MPYQINQELCSCCHRCRVECPVQAIRFKDSKYWIDPNKCISCGHCSKVCHNDIISNPERPVTITPHEPIRLDCQVLVIGGGASGLAAAAHAAELGKKVLVLEKNKEVGGSAWYAHVFRSYYSKWHEQAGLPDARLPLYREFMEKTQGHVDRKLVRNILDANVDFIDWLIEKHDLGKDYGFGPQFWGGYGPQAKYDWAYNHKRIDTTIGPGGTGWYMSNKLLKILLDCGGDIRYRTQATSLILDESGAVVGVHARDTGGELTISCERCIIASGAFSRNKELTNKFNPIFYREGVEPVHVFTCATCTGDGILMCEEQGMDIDYHNARAAMLGPMRHPFGTAGIVAGTTRYGIMVNSRGELFDKGAFGEAISPLAYQPGQYAWQISNEASIARAEAESEGRPEDVPGCDMNPFYKNWKAELQQESDWGSIEIADTLEALAEKLHVPAENLHTAIAAYNATCGKPEMGFTPHGPRELPPKDPIEGGPYYAILMKLFHENALGGIAIDENTQVLRDGLPVPGLYAVGDTTRGVMLPGRIGADYIESTISALTFALCSGYLAGGVAAQ